MHLYSDYLKPPDRFQMAKWARSNFVDVEFFAQTSYEELAGAEPVTESVKSFSHIDSLLKFVFDICSNIQHIYVYIIRSHNGIYF